MQGGRQGQTELGGGMSPKKGGAYSPYKIPLSQTNQIFKKLPYRSWNSREMRGPAASPEQFFRNLGGQNEHDDGRWPAPYA